MSQKELFDRSTYGLHGPEGAKQEFLLWLDRFCYVQHLKKEVQAMKFSDDDLKRMKVQVERKYRLKAKVLDQVRRRA